MIYFKSTSRRSNRKQTNDSHYSCKLVCILVAIVTIGDVNAFSSNCYRIGQTSTSIHATTEKTKVDDQGAVVIREGTLHDQYSKRENDDLVTFSSKIIAKDNNVVNEEQDKENRNDQDHDDHNSESIDQENSDNEESVYDENYDDEDLQKEKRRKAAALAMALKSKSRAKPSRSRSASVTERKATRTKTSVGQKRVGSASRARGRGGGMPGRLLDGLRTSAAAAAAANEKSKPKVSPDEKSTKQSRNNETNGLQNRNRANHSNEQKGTSALHTKTSIIQNVIQNLVSEQNVSRSSSRPTMGLLGERSDKDVNDQIPQIYPFPGTTLVNSASSLTAYAPNPFNNIAIPDIIKRESSVRVASPSDDVAVANLRLSVFSDFSEDLRREFCERSCEVLNNRRLKGATCILAQVNKQVLRKHQLLNKSEIKKQPNINDGWVIGSAECSTHEFCGTELGRRRPAGSIIYITEVAVTPSSRRCGIGAMLLKGIDKLARLRKIETIYLHVDVENTAAYELYKKSGYLRLDSTNPLYNEFTTKLNLHDGATKGRNHYLLHKPLTENQTWLEASTIKQLKLGFELP